MIPVQFLWIYQKFNTFVVNYLFGKEDSSMMYESPAMEIVAFEIEDVITMSGDPNWSPPTQEE